MPNIVGDLNKLKKKSSLAELAQTRPKLSYGPPSSGNGAPEGQPAPVPEPPPLETVGAHPETVANTPRPELPPARIGQVPLQVNYAPPPVPAGPSSVAMATPSAPPKSYDEMRPQLDAEPERPTFAPKQGGLGRRLLAGLSQMGMMARGGGDPTAKGFQAIGGLIGGLVHPDQAEQQAFEAGPVAKWQEMVAAVRAKNKAKMGEFAQDVSARKNVAELNEIGQPKFQPLPGAAVGTLYNPRAGNAVQPLGANGMPIPMASVTNAQARAEAQLEQLQRRHDLKLAELDAETKEKTMLKELAHKQGIELTQLKNENQTQRDALQNAAKKKNTEYVQGQQNRRHSVSEAGKNKRQDKALTAKEKMINQLRAPGGKLTVPEKDKDDDN